MSQNYQRNFTRMVYITSLISELIPLPSGQI